ncbi:MAG: acetylglutamate kinase [Tindallia sp. MSAO_Bac2]|nr:MAG: acetylglutamate kinase [Tindallia sp. MSAO_Bac2]
MVENIDYDFKPEALLRILPHIRKYHKKIILIKYGGNAMINEELKKKVVKDIVFMKYVGIYPVVMHGGGPEITNMLQLMGKETEFVDGLRVTDKETMMISEMVLSGKIAKELVAMISAYGVKSIGISGQDGGVIKADQKDPKLGFVGDIKSINSELIHDLLEKDYIPVISSIGCNENGERFNINADEAAGKMAVAMGAKMQLMLTDIEGVMKDDGNGLEVIPEMTVTDINRFIEDGTITGGMIPKVNCCAESVQGGVERVHIIDGRKDHSILFEVFTDIGAGTVIKK